MNHHLTWARTALLAVTTAAAALALQGCGTSAVSKGISDDGAAADVVFPDIDKAAWLREGTFPNLDNLRRIQPGTSKDQLYDLVGRPHFDEGMGTVREWDYIFNFRTGRGSEFTTCQYKVIFDRQLLAKSTYWKPAGCGSRLDVPAVVVKDERPDVKPNDPEIIPQPPRTVRLSADALFAFDRSDLGSLLPAGRQSLDRLAAELRALGEIDRLDVVGHADRLGSAGYNQQLSEARARTVRGYLVGQGLTVRSGQATGQGEAHPVVTCSQVQHAALVACLAPNRRVEVTVSGTGKR